MIESSAYFLLGAIQGIIEWLPISSQGNLALIIANITELSSEEIINLTVFLHLGTVLSALVYLREDVLKYLKALKSYEFGEMFGSEGNKVISFLLISTSITGILGAILYTQLIHFLTIIEGKTFIALIGCFLIVTGIFQRISSGYRRKDRSDIGLIDSILLGVAQSLSILPGISRSGTTISALLLRDYDQETSLKLSFLMSIPAVIAANAFLILTGKIIAISPYESFIIVSTSFVAGYIALKGLFTVANKVKFWSFCLLLGSIALLSLGL